MSKEQLHKKISTLAKVYVGLYMGAGIANLYFIVTSKYEIPILLVESAVAVAILGYKFYKAGLRGREDKINYEKANSQYLYSLEIEQQAGTGGTFYSREE